ncbi:hypothetical protein [Planotetraspora sp. GP83]|uniref:hypothetical protein n=1 Tax=Planotetraspora sp. GP83 TaxID=3156264 RepID=UPI003516F630
MTEHHGVACSAFVDELNELRELAGCPTLSELRKLSERTGADGSRRRVLAESTTHDILTGKRSRLPDWPWIASFVAACQAAAAETGLDLVPLGTIQDWLARWRAARTSQPAATPVAPTTPTTPTTPPSGGQDEAPAPARSSDVAVPKADPSPPPISAQMRRYREAFNRTGTRLVRQAEAGDAHACMRLAVLTLLQGWPSESREWLRRAQVEGDRDAMALDRHPDARDMAAELSYRYGREYVTAVADKTSIAMLFFRMAASHGHADAAYELGQLHARKGDQWSAATWFSRAANHHHPHAAAEFNAISERLSNASWNGDWAVQVDLMWHPPPA